MISEDQSNEETAGELITGKVETTVNDEPLGEGINVINEGSVNDQAELPPVVTEPSVDSVPAVTETPPVVAEPTAVPVAPSLTTQFTAASAVVEVETPVVETKGPVALSEFEAFVEKIRTEGTVSQKNLLAAFDLYMDQLAPGKVIDPNVGARAQYTFWKVLFNVIENSPQEEFKRQWNIVLAFFNNNSKETNQIFHPRKAFRFFEFWINGDDELNAYQRILNLIQLTADPSEREAGLKRVDVSRALETTFTEVGRARLLGFYQK